MRQRSAILALAALGAGMVLGACASDTLDGRTFTATEVRGHDLVEGSVITLHFEDGNISAQAGCNTLVGGTTWDQGNLDVGEPLASTMMACEDDLMSQDEWLTEFLTSSPALSLAGDTLTLGDDTTGITLTEEK